MISRSFASTSFGTSSERKVARRKRRDLHRHVARELGRSALELDEHADPRAVHVRADVALALDELEAAHVDVLADLRDEIEPTFLERAPLRREAISASRLAGRLSSTTLGDALGEAAEVVVLRDEVGLGVDLDERVTARALVALEHDAAFRRDARRLLVRLRLALLAQQLAGGIEVAVRVDERLLAIHHARARALAELLDQSRFHVHCRSPHSLAALRASSSPVGWRLVAPRLLPTAGARDLSSGSS